MHMSDPPSGEHVTTSTIKAVIPRRWTTRRGACPRAARLIYGPLGSVWPGGAGLPLGEREEVARGRRQIYVPEDGGVSPACRSP